MPRLDAATYLDHLRRDSARFREVLAGTGPTARVPACPDWDAADLLWHLAEVQHFWATVVRARPAEPDETHLERPTSYDDLLGTFDTCSVRLQQALAAADPAEPAWHWSAEQSVGASYRRQAHEALVHRIDAEQTAGLDPTPPDPALAADGVVELLEWMYGGQPPGWGTFRPGAAVLLLELVDTGTRLWVAPGRLTGTRPNSGEQLDGPHLLLVPDPGRPADATITGTAGAVDTWLWKRRDDTGIEQAGDPEALAALAEAVGPPID